MLSLNKEMIIANNVEEVLVQMYLTTTNSGIEMKAKKEHLNFVLNNVLKRIKDDASVSKEVKARVGKIGRTKRGTKALVSILAILTENTTKTDDDVKIVRSRIIEAYYWNISKATEYFNKTVFLHPTASYLRAQKMFRETTVQKSYDAFLEAFTDIITSRSNRLQYPFKTRQEVLVLSPTPVVAPRRRNTGLLGQIRERPKLRKTSTAVIAKERTGFLSGIKMNAVTIKDEEEDDDEWKI
jgi:hypothetical protein